MDINIEHRMRSLILIPTVGLMLLTMVVDANAQKALKPSQHWGGLINETGKKSAAPKSKLDWVGYLNSQDAFDK
jgi:hypothetical protein